MTTYTEDFNTGDGLGLGPDLAWSEFGDWSIASNRARQTGGADIARADADVDTADMYAQARGYFTDTGTETGVIVRWHPSDFTFYTAFRNANNMLTRRWVTGSVTAIGSAGITEVSGSIERLEARGSSLKAFYNGAAAGAFTDTNIPGNTRGGLIGSLTTDATHDDFEVGDLPPPTSPYLISTGTQVNMATATTAAVAIPAAGQVAGRLIFVHFTGKTTSGTVTPPSGEGWTTIATLNSQTNLYDVVCAKVWGLGGQTDNTTTGNFTATNSPTTNGWGYTLTVWVNPAHATTPWTSVASCYEDVQGVGHAAASPMVAADATSTGTDRTVLRIFGSADDNAHASPSTGALVYGGANYDQTTSTTDYAQSMSYLEGVGSGAVGTSQMTQGAVGNDVYDEMTIVLKIPAAATGGRPAPRRRRSNMALMRGGF